MTLTKEQRIELLAKARLAKANKRMAIKESEPDDDDDEPVVNVKIEHPEPEPEPPKIKKTRKKNEVVPLPVPVEVIQEPDEEPLPVPKKKLPVKWLKQVKTQPEKVCCNDKVSKEEYLIDDDKPQAIKEVVVPSKKEIKKPRAPRASTNTLNLTEPVAIEEVLQDISNDMNRYLPPQKRQQTPLPPVSTPAAPISIKKVDPPLKLFYY
jgi:hypothetical protein